MAVFRTIALASALWLAAAPTKALDLAGKVAALQGSALATGPNGLDRRLQVGSTILVGDRVATSPDGRLRLAMNDGAALALGDASTITIAVYDVDESGGRAVLDLDQGTVAVAGGAIAGLGPDRFTITTPMAVVGVGNAEVSADLFPDRLVLMLLAGSSVNVITPLGSVDLTRPETGLDVVPGEPPPPPAPMDAVRLEGARRAVAFR
jgi:FecR-like protein